MHALGYAIIGTMALSGSGTMFDQSTQLITVETPGVEQAVCKLESEDYAKTIMSNVVSRISRGGERLNIECTAAGFFVGNTSVKAEYIGHPETNAVTQFYPGVGYKFDSPSLYAYPKHVVLYMSADPDYVPPVAEGSVEIPQEQRIAIDVREPIIVEENVIVTTPRAENYKPYTPPPAGGKERFKKLESYEPAVQAPVAIVEEPEIVVVDTVPEVTLPMYNAGTVAPANEIQTNRRVTVKAEPGLSYNSGGKKVIRRIDPNAAYVPVATPAPVRSSATIAPSSPVEGARSVIATGDTQMTPILVGDPALNGRTETAVMPISNVTTQELEQSVSDSERLMREMNKNVQF